MHGTWPHVSDGMRSQAPPSNGGPPCPHGHALQRLACVARDARGRACLLGAGAPAHLGELLAPARVLWQESRGPASAAAAQLLGLLLVLRNLCAAGSAATAALLRCSAPAQVAALVLLLAPRAPPPAAQPGVRRGLAARRAGCTAARPADRGRAPGSAKLLVVAAQLLANLAASSAEAARSVWAACEPGAFLALARVPDGAGGRVAAPPARLQRRGGGRRLTRRVCRQRARPAVPRPAPLQPGERAPWGAQRQQRGRRGPARGPAPRRPPGAHPRTADAARARPARASSAAHQRPWPQAEGGGPPAGADHAAALVGELALERGLLPWLLRATDAVPAGERDTWRAQEALLRLLAAAVDERAGRRARRACWRARSSIPEQRLHRRRRAVAGRRLEAPAGEGRSGTGMDGLAASLQALVTAAASHAEAAADGPGRAPVLRAAMAVRRSPGPRSCARPAASRARSQARAPQALRSLSSVEAGAWRARLVEDLRCAGAVAQLLAMLAALGPATRRRPAPHPGAQQPVACAAPAAAGLRPELADRARGLPSSAPYIGYRTDAAAGPLRCCCQPAWVCSRPRRRLSLLGAGSAGKPPVRRAVGAAGRPGAGRGRGAALPVPGAARSRAAL